MTVPPVLVRGPAGGHAKSGHREGIQRAQAQSFRTMADMSRESAGILRAAAEQSGPLRKQRPERSRR